MKVLELVDPSRLNELGPGRPNRALYDTLTELAPSDLFEGHPITDPDMAACCLSAIWLWNDFLDQSHSISQSIETPCGSYWHGIMHRREPDYPNAAYWFRRVGHHDVFPPLAEQSRQLAESHGTSKSARFLTTNKNWDPYAFIDLCEAIARGRADDRQLCQEIARAEWKLLFDYCWKHSTAD